ncbi:MAG: sensor histidine kinase [Kurthia sp.]|nr:sensor histidine kinase [Candidatus Kurthia equi]
MKSFWRKYNTLRNQIFLLFSLVSIVIVVAITSFGYNKFIKVYDTIIQSQLEQTSVELNRAMEAKYEQINSIASQVATDEDIQKLMFDLQQGPPTVSMEQQQQFKKVLRRYYPYVTTIYDYRFYTMQGRPVFPSSTSLQHAISPQWITKAGEANGKLIWIGQDSQNMRYSYAIKTIRSMNHSFKATGFLVLKLENAYFNTQFENDDNFVQIFDSEGQKIAGPESPNLLHGTQEELRINEKRYKIIQSVSADTNWTVYVAQSTNIYDGKIKNIRYFMILVSIIVAVIAFILSWIIASSITKPLKRLTAILRMNRKDNKMSTIEASTHNYEFHMLYKTYNEFITHINALIDEVYEKQLLQKQAELKAWQSQINPHFLYNTLNSFYWRLIEHGEDDLADQVLSMSELFKYSIHSSKSIDIVSLEQEIHHIDNYLNLMKMRLGDRLQWEVQCSPTLENLQIPKLLLQPLIENAIIHGIEPKRTNGFIRIAIIEAMHDITITISDNGIGISDNILQKLNNQIDLSRDNENIAIQNIQMRLSIHYSTQVAQSLHFSANKPCGTIVTLTIPKGEFT